MPITPLPPAPSRADPSTFADKSDALLGSLDTFVTEANALETNVNNAESSAVAAADAAAASETNAADSAASALGASNYAGEWSTLTGALNIPASVFHADAFWVLKSDLADVTTSEPGVSADWVPAGGGSIDYYAYDNRSDLRTVSASDGDLALVEGLGLFRYYDGSTEIDDDESCFATASGRWLITAIDFGVVYAWLRPEVESRDADIATAQSDIATAQSDIATLQSTLTGVTSLVGTATCAISSITATNSATFTGTLAGAAVGDSVIVNPPAEIGSTAANTGRLSYHARVTAADTVTITITNASAATATLSAEAQADWDVLVIKE